MVNFVDKYKIQANEIVAGALIALLRFAIKNDVSDR